MADVKALLSGGKVPVLKGKEDWSLSLDGLFGFAAGKGLEGSKNRESGLSYEQYLTIFLFFSPAARLLYRMMDVIEMNLKREQENFKLSRCAYRVDIQAHALWKTRFIFPWGFVEKHGRLWPGGLSPYGVCGKGLLIG